ncbi:MAG: hypothetical protein FVQ84_08455 [Planctomycetes bacterium]|nr:hypothetical protein [Planctomycetota bacterium]
MSSENRTSIMTPCEITNTQCPRCNISFYRLPDAVGYCPSCNLEIRDSTTDSFWIVCKDIEGMRRFCSASFSSNSEDCAWVNFGFWDEKEHWEFVGEDLNSEQLVEVIKDKSKFHGWYCIKMIVSKSEKLK